MWIFGDAPGAALDETLDGGDGLVTVLATGAAGRSSGIAVAAGEAHERLADLTRAEAA